MPARRLLRWIPSVVPVILFGMALVPGPPATLSPQSPSLSFISAPREPLPLPVHDEATCAFCQAAAFVPHAGHAGAVLPIVWGTEHHTVLSYDDRLTHAGSARPPRSREPPTLQ
jgi:hypothetical protein